MTAEQFIEMFGGEEFEKFSVFMTGQTVKVLDTGEAYFYKHDIENYFNDGNLFFD